MGENIFLGDASSKDMSAAVELGAVGHTIWRRTGVDSSIAIRVTDTGAGIPMRVPSVSKWRRGRGSAARHDVVVDGVSWGDVDLGVRAGYRIRGSWCRLVLAGAPSIPGSVIVLVETMISIRM